MEKGQDFVKSVVPITARGRVKYLKYEDIPDSIGKLTPQYILEHEKSVTLYIGKTIELGGYVAYFEAYTVIERYDGEIILINSMAEVKPGIVEIKD